MSQKLLVCDVEGTIFKAKYRIEGTDYASTMWQPLAMRLGEEAIREEKVTHEKWDNKEYGNYIEWVNATVEIHKKHGLVRTTFDELINAAEYNHGVLDFFANLDRSKYIPVLVSGGFQELVNKAKKSLQINYGYGACEYVFDDASGLLSSHSLTPCDFEGKYNYVEALFHIYNLNPNSDWIFVGDGKNDVHIAEKAPLSFGINAHPDLANLVTYNVNSFDEIFNHITAEESIVFLGADDLVLDGESFDEERDDQEYAALVNARDTAVAQAVSSTESLKKLQAELTQNKKRLKAETKKRKQTEAARAELEENYARHKRERADEIIHVAKLEADLRASTKKARAEVALELGKAKDELAKKEKEMAESYKEMNCQEKLLEIASKEITEAQEKVGIHELLNEQLQCYIKEVEGDLSSAIRKQEDKEEARRKEVEALWRIHFPSITFEPGPVRFAAKQTFKDRCKIEKKLRELHESTNPRSLSRGRLRGKNVNDHCGLQLTAGVPARIEYNVLSDRDAHIDVIKIYKHGDKYMQ